MNLYGPSAATGLMAGAGSGMIVTTTGHPLQDGIYIGLAVFTLIGAGLAAMRSMPKRRAKKHRM